MLVTKTPLQCKQRIQFYYNNSSSTSIFYRSEPFVNQHQGLLTSCLRYAYGYGQGFRLDVSQVSGMSFSGDQRFAASTEANYYHLGTHRQRITNDLLLIPTYLFIMIPPLIDGALSDAFVWCLMSVWRLSVTYIGPKSRTERSRKTKIGTEVAHITCDSNTTFKVKRSKVKVTRPHTYFTLTRKAAAAVSVRTYSAWESTATFRLLGGARRGEERGGGILCRHAHSLLWFCYLRWITLRNRNPCWGWRFVVVVVPDSWDVS